MKGWVGPLVFLAAVAFGFGSGLQDRPDGPRCMRCGAASNTIGRVQFLLPDGTRQVFCSIPCALAVPLPAGARVRVTDEATGDEVDADAAFFVESEAVSVAHNRTRIHAFARTTDASAHVRAHQGRWVPNPFRK
ncbi:hypothetical protein JCM30394_05500 [Deferrisoma palaeochoriense]